MARQDERGELGIAEALEQAPDVAIDRFLPAARPPIEIAAHERAVDARIDGRGIEGHQAALAIADDADFEGRFCFDAPLGDGQIGRFADRNSYFVAGSCSKDPALHAASGSESARPCSSTRPFVLLPRVSAVRNRRPFRRAARDWDRTDLPAPRQSGAAETP